MSETNKEIDFLTPEERIEMQTEQNREEAGKINRDYRYGFSDGKVGVLQFKRGLSEEVVRHISQIKKEPEWMLNFRLEGLKLFNKIPLPDFGCDLSHIDWDGFCYYLKPSDHKENSWDKVPGKIKDTFKRLGIPEAEKNFLCGVSTQYESEVVYHKVQDELKKEGVIFLDTETGMREYPELFRKYFGKIVPTGDNKLSALNSACWSGGSFIYVPKGIKVSRPLQAYFRINAANMGQFERTLIIVDDDADVHYVEGCTAPTYSEDALHSGVIEIYVGKNARCRYTTIQNWSNNVYNLVTQRAYVEEGGSMEWVDGNLGGKLTMKYPACILAGPYAKGSAISIAVAGEGQIQNAGSRMIHLAPHTSSTVISKSIARDGGEATYRGTIEHGVNAKYAKTNVSCDTLILDEKSKSDTFPTNRIKNGETMLQHEATVSKISAEQLFYLQSRGLTEQKASKMIVMGFIEPFTRELPMEYAVELNQLMHLDMTGAQG